MPFWAAICGYLLINETIGLFTMVAMIISFGGVALIACSPYIIKDGEAESEEVQQYGISSVGLANLVGCLLILVNSLAQGLVAVTTRMMQKIHWSVILFYYSLVALLSITLTYLISAPDKSRLFSYNGE